MIERWVPIASQYAALAAQDMRDWLGVTERAGDAAWVVGRWLGKTLVLELLNSDLPLRDVTIISTDGRGRRNRPQVYVQGRLLGVRLSLAHSRRFAYAAAALEPGLRFGVDVADVEDIGTALPGAWFSAEEQVAARTPIDTLRIWTAKEACYKACQQGEAFVPQRCAVRPDGEAVYDGQFCRIRWAADETMVRALAVAHD